MSIGAAPRSVTPGGPYVVVDPAWSPRGDAIVYASDRSGSMDLWVHELASGQERRLTRAPGAEMRPAWSPDGKRIAYVSAHGAYAEDVWVMDLADGASRRIEAAGDSPGYPNWLPDGSALMVARLQSYSSSQSYYAGGVNQVRIVPLDGGPARDLTVLADHSIGNRSGDGPALSPTVAGSRPDGQCAMGRAPGRGRHACRARAGLPMRSTGTQLGRRLRDAARPGRWAHAALPGERGNQRACAAGARLAPGGACGAGDDPRRPVDRRRARARHDRRRHRGGAQSHSSPSSRMVRMLTTGVSSMRRG